MLSASQSRPASEPRLSAAAAPQHSRKPGARCRNLRRERLAQITQLSERLDVQRNKRCSFGRAAPSTEAPCSGAGQRRLLAAGGRKGREAHFRCVEGRMTGSESTFAWQLLDRKSLQRTSIADLHIYSSISGGWHASPLADKTRPIDHARAFAGPNVPEIRI